MAVTIGVNGTVDVVVVVAGVATVFDDAFRRFADVVVVTVVAATVDAAAVETVWIEANLLLLFRLSPVAWLISTARRSAVALKVCDMVFILKASLSSVIPSLDSAENNKNK